MRILIVYCHPVEDSFAASLHRVVLQGLSSAGHELIDLDLYAESFAPVLSRQERVDYFDTARNFEPVKYYVDQLLSVDGIVLIYPTWWYGMPAMLKGYFDRVWLPGIAFDINPTGGITTGRLAHIRCIAVVTTYGSPWWLIRLYLGDPARKIVMRGLRRLCAPRCRALWYASYNMDRASPEALRAFLDRVLNAMSRL